MLVSEDDLGVDAYACVPSFKGEDVQFVCSSKHVLVECLPEREVARKLSRCVILMAVDYGGEDDYSLAEGQMNIVIDRSEALLLNGWIGVGIG